MKFDVLLTSLAERDVAEAFAWYLAESPAAAVRWQEHLADALESLTTFPERCRVATDRAFLRRTVRQLVFGGRGGEYRLLFELQGRRVYVLRLRHGARKLLEAPNGD